MKFLHLIWSNAQRSKLRTGLTVASTAIALFLFCMLRTIVTPLDASVEGADEARAQEVEVAAGTRGSRDPPESRR